MKPLPLSTVTLLLLLAGSLRAEGWGEMNGQFVYDGMPPKLVPPVAKAGFCGAKPLVNEELLVDAKTGGVANVVLWMHLAEGATVPIHDGYKAAAKNKVVLDNNTCRFEPHVLPIMTAQPLELKNSDPEGHNTNISSLDNPQINVLIVPNGVHAHSFKNPENLPVNVSCNIHSWMNAKVVVKNHPYVAVTGTDGKFSLRNVPTGDWTFRLWHEKGGYLKEAEIGGKSEKLTGGKYKVTITGGKSTDLGVVKVKL